MEPRLLTPRAQQNVVPVCSLLACSSPFLVPSSIGNLKSAILARLQAGRPVTMTRPLPVAHSLRPHHDRPQDVVHRSLSLVVHSRVGGVDGAAEGVLGGGAAAGGLLDLGAGEDIGCGGEGVSGHPKQSSGGRVAVFTVADVRWRTARSRLWRTEVCVWAGGGCPRRPIPW